MKFLQLNKIYKDIKSVKIQGATNVARAALKAYSLSPKKSTIKKLKSLRPTEPMLQNVLKNKKIKKFKDCSTQNRLGLMLYCKSSSHQFLHGS